MEVWMSYLIGIPLYGGAILPMASAALFPNLRQKTSKRSWITLCVLGGSHILSFLPYAYFAAQQHSDAMFALWLPALTGSITFVAAVVLLFLVSRRKS